MAKKTERPLFMVPEIVDIIGLVEMLFDDFNNRAANFGRFWHDGDGSMLTVREVVLERLEAIGLKVEIRDGTIGRKKAKLLDVSFPDSVSKEEAEKFHKEFAAYRKRMNEARKAKRS